MTTVTDASAGRGSTLEPARRTTIIALWLAAIVFTIGAAIDLALRPSFANDRVHTTGDYLMAGWIIPFMLVTLLMLVRFRRLHAGRDGRLGYVAFILVAIAVVAFCVDGTATVITGRQHVFGPLYPISTLISFIGFILYAIAAFRGRVLPRWAGPALAVAWIFGGPVEARPGLFLLLTAVCLSVAFALPRSAPVTDKELAS